MEYRIIRVGGWELQVQVLPVVKLISGFTVAEDAKCLSLEQAYALALEILND